ncbi:MAG: hypothetical protein ACI9VM_000551, partial [Candidatus Azotimanducaceae bacterium]
YTGTVISIKMSVHTRGLRLFANTTILPAGMLFVRLGC